MKFLFIFVLVDHKLDGIIQQQTHRKRLFIIVNNLSRFILAAEYSGGKSKTPRAALMNQNRPTLT